MGRLEKVIQLLEEIYSENADADGKLSKEKIQKMVEQEVENPEVKAALKAKCEKFKGMNPARQQRMMRRFGKEEDGVNYKQFCMRVMMMAVCSHEKKCGVEQECDDSE